MPEVQESVPPPLRCAGIGLRGSGYPNATNTLRRLRAAGVQIDDRVHWLPDGLQLWKIARGTISAKLALYARLLLGNAWAAWRLCQATTGDRRVAYVPYPAIFLLWWLSWIPQRWRPPLVADAYISIWDSTVRDRAMLGSKRISSRLLRAFEARALRIADVVLVDTVANRDWMIDAFGLDPATVLAIPLAVDDADLLQIPPPTPKAPLNVLFIGTFVPLHGVDVLAATVRRAQAHRSVQFHFVGDGQDAGKIEDLLTDGLQAFTWERSWLSHPQIIERLAQSDVCLGVFGGSAKASRVLPFKLYLALAAGRAIVTQQNFSLPEGVPLPPFVLVEADPARIVERLLVLADDPTYVAQIGLEARRFYQEWLGDHAMLRTWLDVLVKLDPRGSWEK